MAKVDYYMPPFKSAVQRARVAAIMCSYNGAYGKPTCASDEMNNQMVCMSHDEMMEI